MKFKMLWIAGLMLAATAGQVQGGPIVVSYIVTGSAGNYDLDFSVTNNIPANPSMGAYLFGVELSARNIIASPSAAWDENHVLTWDNSSYGGSSTIYNNIWYETSYTQILPGSTLSGFKVHVTDLVAPTSVKWFAFGYGGSEYLGGDNFYLPNNPAFEGVASSTTAVPEPSSIAMLGIGAIGLFARRRRQQMKLAA